MSGTARAALETTRVLYDMATLLDTGLDRETLSVCISLCENNVNPEALAAVIKELRRESAALRAQGGPSASAS